MGESFTHALEKDLTNTYKGSIWNKFIKSLKQFQLVEEGDRIMVALSGGKDSLLLATLMKALKRHPLVHFDVVFVTMDPGYPTALKARLVKQAETLGLDVHIEPTTVFDVVNRQAPDNPCFLCARVRRGILYRLAREHGCNKIALGHHYDDVIETTMLNLLFSGSVRTMLPKVASHEHPGMTLIRPLYFVREAAIIDIINQHGFDPIRCGCPLAEKTTTSKRAAVKQWIQNLNAEHPGIDASIFRAPDNVYLDYVLGWQEKGKRHQFDD